MYILTAIIPRDRGGHHSLGISHTRETGPADIGAIGEEVDEVLGLGQLVQERSPLDTALQKGGSSHDGSQRLHTSTGGEMVRTRRRREKNQRIWRKRERQDREGGARKRKKGSKSPRAD